jgi:hypothetical protein
VAIAAAQPAKLPPEAQSGGGALGREQLADGDDAQAAKDDDAVGAGAAASHVLDFDIDVIEPELVVGVVRDERPEEAAPVVVPSRTSWASARRWTTTGTPAAMNAPTVAAGSRSAAVRTRARTEGSGVFAIALDLGHQGPVRSRTRSDRRRPLPFAPTRTRA